jgi:hypothetical protein
MAEDERNFKCYVEKSKTADYSSESAMGNSKPKFWSFHNMKLRITGKLPDEPPVDPEFEAFNWRNSNPYNPNTQYCGGGRRRRRVSSRKYRKSSRRVFRKKSRATRRR